MSEKKMRVSSKQRLDLIKIAYNKLMKEQDDPRGLGIDDYARFMDDVEEALFNKLHAEDRLSKK